jgi:hypothetical protein
MVERYGPETVQAWERRFLEPGSSFDDLARPELDASPRSSAARPPQGLFFAQGSWYLPVLRPEADPSTDALILLDATSKRRYRQALDELAVYGCRFARLVVLSQRGLGSKGDPERSAEFPVPWSLRLPSIRDSSPIPDALLPVVTGLLATAAAAASSRAAAASRAAPMSREAPTSARGTAATAGGALTGAPAGPHPPGRTGAEPGRGAEAELLVQRAFGLIGEALLRSGISLSALNHAQVAALRSLAPLVTGIRRSARFEIRRVQNEAELGELGRHGKIRGLTEAGWEALREAGTHGTRPSIGELFLLRSESGSRGGPWFVAFGTSWEALSSRNVAIGERLDGTPLLEVPVLADLGESGHLYRFTVRYLEWDHASPVAPQLKATIEAMQKGLPSLNRPSPGYLALAGGVREALRDWSQDSTRQAEGPWLDWLLALVPRSWLLHKASQELARVLAARAGALLEVARAADRPISAAEALTAAGSALEELWGELTHIDGGNDEERWPLLKNKLADQLAGGPAEPARNKAPRPRHSGSGNPQTRPRPKTGRPRSGRPQPPTNAHGGTT